MSSGVADPHVSPAVGVQGSRYQPTYSSRTPNPQRPGAQSLQPAKKSHLTLVPAEGWFAMALLTIAVYCVVYSIISAGWVGNTYILNWSAAAGLLVGLAVAKIRRMPQPIMHLAACLIGHWLSIWLTSAFVYHVYWTVIITGIGAALTDPTRIGNGGMVFLFYLSFLSFFLSYFGAWLIYRAHLPWLVAIVYCSIFLVNLNYSQQDLSLVFGLFLAAVILLIARIHLTFQLLQWKSEGLYTDKAWLRGITSRFIKIASVIAVVALLFSWVLPVLSQPTPGLSFWNELNNVWSNITQGHISWQNPGSIVQAYQAPTNFFGNQLTIAGSVHLPNGEVLDYTSQAAPQYLEGFTYDQFDGHTWTSTSSDTQNFDANALLPNETSASSTTATTTIKVVLPPESTQNYIFGPPQPAVFNIPTTVYGDTIVSAWAKQGALTQGETYQVTSLLPTFSPQDLSQIPLPNVDPGFWQTDANYRVLQQYYLQLPTDLSPRVLQTAQQWTAGYSDTYDILKMLEKHLSDSSQFVYSLDNPPVPTNIDAVDWLLQTHHGYCTYYATAMVTMARLLGIPARIVNGFSQGHLDLKRKLWVVNGSDAHSWVQAYSPGYGWINFDPTPGYSVSNGNSPQPVTTPTPHPTKPTPTPTKTKKGAHQGTPTGTTPKGGSFSFSPAQQTLLVGVSATSLLISILVLLVALLRYWWSNLYANSTFVARTYWRICRLASLLGFTPRDSQTPYEYTKQLCRTVPHESAAPLWRLTELFVRERWSAPRHSPYTLAEYEQKQIWSGFRRVFLRLAWLKTKRNKHGS